MEVRQFWFVAKLAFGLILAILVAGNMIVGFVPMMIFLALHWVRVTDIGAAKIPDLDFELLLD